MGKQEEFSDKLLKMGYVDDKKVAVLSSAKKLPNGEWGLCILCLNKNLLTIVDTDIQQAIKQKLYEIDLSKISNYKFSSFIFNPFIKFVYENFTYKFTNFGDAKNFINDFNNRTEFLNKK